MRVANYFTAHTTTEYTVIQDLGPWDEYPTITNSAEEVVAEMIKFGFDWKNRKLYYIDSEGDTSELIIKDGKFSAFGPNGVTNV